MIILFITGCIKDKGNYSYNKVNSYFIDTLSLPKTYVAKQNAVVTLDPVNTKESGSTDLSYEWRLMQDGYVVNAATGTFFNKQLATTKHLSFKVTDAPGGYILVLYITDKSKGGVSQIIKVPFAISSYASQGWMLLHGNAITGSDVSIIVNNKLNSLLPSGTDYVQANVFSETNGTKVQGDGADIFYMTNNWVDIFTKNNGGGYRVSGNDLRVISTYANMFVSPLQQTEINYQAYAGWSYNELLVNNGDLYFVSQPNANTYYPFGVKCFGEDYKAAPFIGTIFNFSYYGVFYDTRNQRFLYIDFNKAIKQFKAPGATAAFDMRNVGKDMVYAEHGYDNRWYCLMQTPGDPLTRELFVAKFNVSDDGNRAVARYNISNGTDLSNAKYFSFGSRGNVMYYATDTKIYQNNYSGDLSSTLRLDVDASYPGNVITSMKLLKSTNHPNDCKILYVALYNPSSQQGTLLQIDVNEVSGVFGSIKSYTGFGKITGMNYKSK
jgi:hypothetical protein